MKKIISHISIIGLVCFSFYYTDRVINYLNNKDPLMLEINEKSSNYQVLPTNALVEDNTIIPGINGIKVNIEKSYEEMKVGRIFREDLLVYDKMYPHYTLKDNQNKYIISGNKVKNNVSILIILNASDIPKLINYNKLTIFINHNDLNINNINKLKNNEIYSYGNNGSYNKDILINDNTIINRTADNKSIYCLSREKNNEVLVACNNANMHVIIPTIEGNYINIKDNLSNGSIILLNNINNIDVTINYINGKGYNIVPLSKLLEE